MKGERITQSDERKVDKPLAEEGHAHKYVPGPYKLLLTVLGLLLLFGSFALVAPTAVFAGEDVALRITGAGVTTPKEYTLDQLQAMEQYQHVYSAINTWPTKKWYVGKGVKLRDLLAAAGIKEEATLIKFTSRDSYTATLTVKELLKDKRFYFPLLKENDPNLGQVPGSPTGAEEVEPILALVSAEGTDNPAFMDDREALLLMMGQRAVTEQTSQLFAKYVEKIEVLTSEPVKWDKPEADPASGDAAPGTLVKLSSVYNDDDKVHYTTDGSDPTIDCPMYNWIASRWWSSRADELDQVNHPIEITKDTIIKAVTIGPGKYDSDIVTFSYQVPDPPVLTADATDNIIGQPVELTFTDDQSWRTAITTVSVGGTLLAEDDYVVDEGKLIIKAGVFKQAGDYRIVIQAAGYADACVTQMMVSALNAPPELFADDTDNVAGQKIELTFADDGAWRVAITGITVDDVALSAEQYSTDTAGVITIDGDVFNAAGEYIIVLQAAGYVDAYVTQVIKASNGGGGPTEPDEDVILTITGDGVATEKTYTLTQLKAMDQYEHVYSAINTWPTKKWYVGKGVKLRDLLNEAGMKSSAKLIKFSASDGFKRTLTVQELFKDKRYYFPGLKDNDENLGQVPGSSAGRQQVEAILGLESAEGSDDPDDMNDVNALLLMLGQRAVTEQTGELFVKKLNKIEVLTSEPEQWDEPEAEPDSGEVAPGTLVKLSSEFNDADKIYYTTNGSTPTLDSPIYNWIASRWWSSRADVLDTINHPNEITKDTTIKAIVIGPGREDSDVVNFTYKVKADASTKNTISTQEGGKVSLGNASIVIPAGALTDKGAEVEIQIVTAPPAVPSGFKLLGSVYEFSVDGEKSYKFTKSVTITLSFDPGAISAGETPAIFYYDEFLGEWINIGGTVSGNTVTVQVDHFTRFAVMAAIKETALTDINGHWAFDNINKLLATGCISGYPDGTFRPDHPISRAEFITVLVKAFGLEHKEGKSFADTAGHWAGEYIATAAACGIANGYDYVNFGPDDQITREQMAVMIVKAAKIEPAAGSPSFADSGVISGWAVEAVNTAAAHGIMKGYPDNTIGPQGNVTRAEAVTVIINALNIRPSNS
ncbi:MAG: Endo-1,4-beta-xylanase A precursor [Pelotomaculum sp. PtaB.Bin104]|nr:MAG: Endo-1,4-beta-xylanase A precursor [Pelotomaculum sp. PtaB.Bin104]